MRKALRSVPWFPLVLAVGWILMVSLAMVEMASFAAATASLGSRVASAPANAVPPATTKATVPVKVAPAAAAAAIAPPTPTVERD